MCLPRQATVDSLYDLLYDRKSKLGMVRVCIRFEAKHRKFATTVEGDRLLNTTTTQYDEVEQLVVDTVLAADRIEETILSQDADPTVWFAEAHQQNE